MWSEGLNRSLSESEIDAVAATLSPGELASFLQNKLGQRPAAHLLGLDDAKQLGRYQKPVGPRPRPVVEARMRETYKLVATIEAELGPEAAGPWLNGTSSALDYRAPADLLRVARKPDDFTPVRTAARQFLLAEATVRDPMKDIEAVKAARQKPMSERLELALNWNRRASELRAGVEDGGDHEQTV